MSDFSKIITSAPVNSQAAKQMGKGVDFNPLKKMEGTYHNMPKMRSVDSAMLKQPDFIDFTGNRFGKLKILGLLDTASSTKASWVCRCDCGMYTNRKSKSLKVAMRGGNSFVDTCDQCRYLNWIRSPEYQTGKTK